MLRSLETAKMVSIKRLKASIINIGAKWCPGSVNIIPYQTKSDYCANTKIRATRNSPSLINGPHNCQAPVSRA